MKNLEIINSFGVGVKKLFLILFCLLFTFLFSSSALAQTYICDESSPDGLFGQNSGKLGLVPCGNNVDIFNQLSCRCELVHIFILILNIYNFIVFNVATPLAGLLIVVGGVILLVSAGNPGLATLARRILWGAFWGVVLVFGGWVIINTVLATIGYTPPTPWWNPF